VAAGLLVAIVATRSLQSLVFGVSLVDALTYGSVVALVAVIVAIASYLPARRAASVEPSALLR
jgi:putative ABC transport system permease protein